MKVGNEISSYKTAVSYENVLYNLKPKMINRAKFAGFAQKLLVSFDKRGIEYMYLQKNIFYN